MKILTTLFFLYFAFTAFAFQEKKPIVMERIYAPNTKVFMDSTGTKLITVSKVSAENKIKENYTLKEGEYLGDLLSKMQFHRSEDSYNYNVLTEYHYDLTTDEIIGIEGETTILVNENYFLNSNTFKEIVFEDFFEDFNQCNNGLDNIESTVLLANIGDYGIVKRKYSSKQSLEIIYVDCSYISTLDLNPKNITYKVSSFNQDVLFLYNNEELMILHIAETK